MQSNENLPCFIFPILNSASCMLNNKGWFEYLEVSYIVPYVYATLEEGK